MLQPQTGAKDDAAIVFNLDGLVSLLSSALM